MTKGSTTTVHDLSAVAGKSKCGIIMPISAIDGCTERHWSDVREILSEAIQASGLEANLVSDANEVGFINKRIVQNIYDNPIVICDVSAKNPNVMFELGMRVAFDKPVILVKDDQTAYSFDIGGIEHLTYPRDLRFQQIREFKEKIELKLRATLHTSQEDPNYTTFLKHFGEFTVAKLDQKEVSEEQFILEELRGIRETISKLQRPASIPSRSIKTSEKINLLLFYKKLPKTAANKLAENIGIHPEVSSVEVIDLGSGSTIVAQVPRGMEHLASFFKDLFEADSVEIIN